MAKKGKFFFISIVMLVLVFGLVYAGITLTSNFGKSTTQVSTENAGGTGETVRGHCTSNGRTGQRDNFIRPRST